MARKWVLIVDDDPLVLTILEEAIKSPDFTITTASDAMQAFIQARDLKPVLVISDIHMPKFGSGDVTMREMRKDARLKGIPFIFVTGLSPDKVSHLVPPDDPSVRLMAKPMDLEKLKQWVREMTGLKVD